MRQGPVRGTMASLSVLSVPHAETSKVKANKKGAMERIFI